MIFENLLSLSLKTRKSYNNSGSFYGANISMYVQFYLIFSLKETISFSITNFGGTMKTFCVVQETYTQLIKLKIYAIEDIFHWSSIKKYLVTLKFLFTIWKTLKSFDTATKTIYANDVFWSNGLFISSVSFPSLVTSIHKFMS